jgi:ferredoxin-thioredoxin reductase catalytic subunit/rhodanese-related sulfurtransferase
MIKKIDVNSDEFIAELEKTKKFTKKVCENFNLVYNPDDEINESVTFGLARNKMIYGKRFCPCFMVEEGEDGKPRSVEDRICPCKPALEDEIPNKGVCHCGIFCTPEYAKHKETENKAEEVAHTHSRGLTKEECEELLSHPQLDGDEIESLLEARELGMIDFLLVDVREWMEWVQQRIVGTDYLVPTTSFYQALEQIEDKKDMPIILYCFTGSRSAYCQQVMLSMGYKHVSNFTRGIISYSGPVESGE